MIKKIYTFGTSFTEGGGFEFDTIDYKYKKLYENFDEDYSQYNFSYPGQLQKLIPNIEVINLAKSGYGNENHAILQLLHFLLSVDYPGSRMPHADHR